MPSDERPRLFVEPLEDRALLNATYHALSSGDFAQNWTDIDLITTSDDWSAVPSIVGYRGDGLTSAEGVDPQTVLGDGSGTPIDVNANRGDPSGFTTGGVTEFDRITTNGLGNSVVGLSGTLTADAPHIVLFLDTTGVTNIRISYVLRDLDTSTDNSVQPVALQYRVGETGDFVNVPAGFVSDASRDQTQVGTETSVSALLPGAIENRAQVQLRIITTNAAGNDEWIGIDDIRVTSGGGAGTPSVTGATTDEDTQTSDGLVIVRNGDAGDATTHYKISGITNGTLFLNDGTTALTDGTFITMAQGAAGLKFTPNANFFGTGSFVVRASTSASDSGLGGSEVTATVTVNPVADTPGVTGATTDEDTQTTGGLVVSRSAADGAEVTHFKIAGITNGTLFLSDGTTAISNGTFLTASQASAGLRFTPAPNFFGTGSFQVTASLSASDAGLGGSVATATVVVNPVNDLAVVATAPGLTLFTEGGPGVAIDPSLTVSDTDDVILSGARVRFVDSYFPGEEVLEFTNTGTITGVFDPVLGHLNLIGTDTVANYEAALRAVTYRNSSRNPSALLRRIEFTATDDVTPSTPATKEVSILLVNDPPTLNDPADTTATVGTGATVALGGISAGGGETQGLRVTATSSNPTVVPHPLVEFTSPNATGSLRFTPLASGTATVTVRVTDDNGTPGDTADDAFVERTFVVTVTRPAGPPAASERPARLIAVGADRGGNGRVGLFTASGAPLGVLQPFGTVGDAVTVAVGDVTGDGNPDLVAATRDTGLITAIDLTAGRYLIPPARVFPAGTGLRVATGDLDGNGTHEIVFGAERGSTALYAYSLTRGQFVSAFEFAPGAAFPYQLAVGDVTGDGRAEFVVSALGFVGTFDASGRAASVFAVAPGTTNEISVAVGDTNRDGRGEIIATLQLPSAGTAVGAFTGTGDSVWSLFAPLFADAPVTSRRGPIAPPANQSPRIAAGDVTGDGRADVLLAGHPGTGTSRLVVLDGATRQVVRNQFAFDPLFAFGTFTDAG